MRTILLPVMIAVVGCASQSSALKKPDSPSARQLAAIAELEDRRALGALPELAATAEDETIADTTRAPGPKAVKTVKARYSRPWLLHGSVGPSCAVAQFDQGKLTVWTHTQGVYP